MSSKASSSDNWVDPDGDPAHAGAGDGAGLLQPEGRRFARQAKCQDWPWIVLWAAQMIVVLAVGLSYYMKYRDEMSSPTASRSGSAPSLTSGTFSLLLLLLGAAVSLAFCYLLLIRAYTRQLIWGSLIGCAVLLGAMLVYFAAVGHVFGAIVCAIALPLQLIYMYFIRDAIPFATSILVTCVRVLKLWPSLFLLAFGGLLLQAAWFVLWLVCALACFYATNVEFDGPRGRPGSTDTADPNKRVLDTKLGFLLFGLLLSYFFTQQLVKNVVHTAVSGVMATWYFLVSSDAHAQRLTPHPVSSSLSRATTTSFGSVVLASLVTAVVKALRATFQLIARWLMADEPSCISMAVVCIVECLLRTIEAIVEYINGYALSYVAVYGKPFFESAQLAFGLMKRRGLDAVVNDDIINSVLIVGSLAIGGLCALMGGLGCEAIFGDTRADWRVWAVIGFLVGFCLSLTILGVIESLVVTLFVCLADSPDALRQTKPDVYQMIVPQLEQREGVDLDEMGGEEGNRRRGGQQV